jgi:GTP-binding protein
LTKTQLASNVESYKKVLLEEWEELPPVFVTSSDNGTGRKELLSYIAEINDSL